MDQSRASGHDTAAAAATTISGLRRRPDAGAVDTGNNENPRSPSPDENKRYSHSSNDSFAWAARLVDTEPGWADISGDVGGEGYTG